MERKEIMEQLRKLLCQKDQKNFLIAETNFQIGRLIAEIEDIPAFARELSAAGVRISESYLFDCGRVFRSLKHEGMLSELRGRLKGNLSWWFLVNHCTKAPVGDSPEAIAYWEACLGRIEQSLGDLTDLAQLMDMLPASMQEQVRGLTEAIRAGFVPTQEREILEGPIKVAHLADLHVSESLTSGNKIVIDPETGVNERLIDNHRCLSFAVDRILAESCRVALITEPTETHRPTPNEQRYLLSSILRLTQAGIPVIVEPGNHGISKNQKDSSALAFLEGRPNVYVVERPSVFYLEGRSLSAEPSENWGSKDCAKIFVLPFPSKGILNGKLETLTIEEQNQAASAALRAIVSDFRSQLDTKAPNILLLHLTILGSQGAQNPEMTKFDPHLAVEDLEGFDYVACGHIHHHQRIGSAGVDSLSPSAANAWYAGSIDRQDFNEEGDPKGFIIASFDKMKTSVEFVKTPAREFCTITPAFFDDPEWENKVDPRTIYRIKGEVSQEEREALRPAINRFMEICPLQYKLTVKREVRVRDAQLTEDMSEETAMRRYFSTKGFDETYINRCLIEFHKVTAPPEGQPADAEPVLFGAA